METTLSAIELCEAVGDALLEDALDNNSLAETVVVIDNGSGLLKAGPNGLADPFVVFPSLVAHLGRGLQPLVGDRASRPDLDPVMPLRKGQVESWADLEALWGAAINDELRAETSKMPVLLAVHPLCPAATRDRMVQSLFKRFNAIGAYVAEAPVLALFSTGRNTGLVVDSGFEQTTIAPIVGGKVVGQALQVVPIGGRHLTERMLNLLLERDTTFAPNKPSQRNIAREIKETLCFVAQNPAEERRKSSRALRRSFNAGASPVPVDAERFLCPEALFDPALAGLADCKALHTAILDSVRHCPEKIQEAMLGNIILCGGNMMFPGMARRMQLELEKASDFDTAPVVTVPPNCRFSVWLGGSLMASFPSFETHCVQNKPLKPPSVTTAAAASKEGRPKSRRSTQDANPAEQDDGEDDGGAERASRATRAQIERLKTRDLPALPASPATAGRACCIVQ